LFFLKDVGQQENTYLEFGFHIVWNHSAREKALARLAAGRLSSEPFGLKRQSGGKKQQNCELQDNVFL
jgi:hypothetical protein